MSQGAWIASKVVGLDEETVGTHCALIRFQDGKICEMEWDTTAAYLGRKAEWLDKCPAAEVWEHHLVTPGWEDHHTHLAMSFFRRVSPHLSEVPAAMIEQVFFAAEEILGAADIRAFARMGAYEALSHGTTHVWEHYYELGALVDALLDTGLSAHVGGTLADLAGPGVARWEATLDATERYLKSGDVVRQQGIEFVLAPHAPDTVSHSLWQRILDLAKRYDCPLHLHLAQSPRETQVMLERTHTDSFGFLQRVGLWSGDFVVRAAHATYLTAAQLRALADLRSQVTLVVCPHSASIFDRVADVTTWQQMGVRWNVGTDCVASNDGLSPVKELRWLWGTGGMKNRLTRRQLAGKILSAAPRLGQRPQLCVWDLQQPAIWPAQTLESILFCDLSAALVKVLVGARHYGDGRQSVGSWLAQQQFYLDHGAEARLRLTGLEPRLAHFFLRK